MTRKTLWLSLALLLAGPVVVGATAADPVPADSLDLEALLRETLARNPEIAQSRELWRAALARVPPAGALADPSLGFMVDEQPFSDGTGMKILSLSQAFPYPGKRSLMTEQARREGESARQEALLAMRRVVTEVKVAYFDLFWMESQLATLGESRIALEDAIAVTRTRYETGQTGQEDLLLLMVEGASLEGDIRHIEAQAKAARSKLNLVIGRERDEPLGVAWIDSLSPFEADLADLVASARQARSSVFAQEHRVLGAEAAYRLAKIGSRPDFEVSAGYMRMPEATNAWQASLSLTLPLWKGRKQEARAREAARTLEAERRGLEVERNRIGISVEDQYAHASSEREIVRQYRDQILPLAELALQAARAAYQTGQTSLPLLLEALRRSLELRTAYYQYLTDSEMHLAQLEEAVGMDLGAIRLNLEETLDAEPGGTTMD